MTRYTLTFFDTKENRRLRYLNGASWTKIEPVEDEHRKLLKEEKRREKRGFFSTRTKWAIMATTNRKTSLLKRL